MITRKISMFLGVGLLMVCMIIASPVLSADANRGYQAIVGEKEAAFTFPINLQKQYEWGGGHGELQYEWQVKVRNENNDFMFGFSLWASNYGKGNLKALLEAGQFDISRETKGGGSALPNLKVEHAVSTDGRELKIILKDKEAMKLLFSKKPKHVIFQSQVLKKKSSRKVPVVYR